MLISKKKLVNNFSKAAESYEQHAIIQRYAARNLAKLASPHIKKEAKILDLGCGTGFMNQYLEQNDIISCDMSLEMLQRNSSSTLINCDFEQLPFKKNSCDVITSSFSLQWLTNFEKTFAEFYEILKPKGLLCFCLPMENSFAEIKSLNIVNLNKLENIDFLKSLLIKNGFNKILAKKETAKEFFKNPFEALKAFKNFGANYKYQQQEKSGNNIFSLRRYHANKDFEVSWEVGYFIFNKK